MSNNYKFHNPEGLYFISFAIVGWLDVFIRNEYRDLFIESLEYCQKDKGLEIHAWCIMSSHVHLVFKSIGGQNPELLIGDLKRFTSSAIVKCIKENPKESRKEFLLNFFRTEAEKSSNVNQYQFWRHDNKPIELWSNKVIKQKIDYVHNNPVDAGLVFNAEDYVYSSAIDYAGGREIIDNVVVFRMFDFNNFDYSAGASILLVPLLLININFQNRIIIVAIISGTAIFPINRISYKSCFYRILMDII